MVFLSRREFNVHILWGDQRGGFLQTKDLILGFPGSSPGIQHILFCFRPDFFDLLFSKKAISNEIAGEGMDRILLSPLFLLFPGSVEKLI